jgi:putative flippase GtrA
MTWAKYRTAIERSVSWRTWSSHKSEFLKFIVSRGVCAIFSYGLYLALLLVVRYEIAYVVSYAAGIALAYFVSSRFVFQVAMSPRSAARFPLVYLAQFVVSFVLLRIAVQLVHIPPSIAYAIAVAVTIPLTFSLSRWIMRAG